MNVAAADYLSKEELFSHVLAHEFGHAYVGSFLGLNVEAINFGGPGVLGSVKFKNDGSDSFIKKLAIVCFSGMVSEMHVHGYVIDNSFSKDVASFNKIRNHVQIVDILCEANEIEGLKVEETQASIDLLHGPLNALHDIEHVVKHLIEINGAIINKQQKFFSFVLEELKDFENDSELGTLFSKEMINTFFKYKGNENDGAGTTK